MSAAMAAFPEAANPGVSAPSAAHVV